MPVYSRKCAIIIPCFNEEKKIKKAANSLSVFLKEQTNFFWHVVFVDDGSIDNTKEEIIIVEKEKNNHNNINFSSVFLSQNQGKGAAIQSGLSSVNADFYGYVDVDLSIDFHRIPDALKILNNNESLVIGQRKNINFSEYSFFRKIGSSFFNFIGRFFLKLPFSDIQCGFKFFNSKVKDIALLVERKRFSFDLEFLLRVYKEKLNIFQLPLDWQHEKDSSVSWPDAVRYFLDVFLITEIAYKKKQWLKLYIFISLFFTLLLFGWTMFYGYFFSDDFTWIWHGWKILTGQITIFRAHMSTFYSPVLNAFYTFSVAVFGLSAWWYFAFGLVVHTINAFLVGVLGWKISDSPITGLVATIFFAIAGGAYEPLVWIGANMHSLAVLFMFLAILCLFFSFDKEKYTKIFYLFLSLIAMFLAFGTKEIAVITPVLLFFSYIFFSRKNNYNKFIQLKYYLTYGCMVVFSSVVYLWQEYLAQKSSVWVTSGVLSFSPKLLLRLPLALVDVFIPLGLFLNENNKIIFLFITTFIILYIVIKYFRDKAILFSFVWSFFAAMTVLFFSVSHWWEVLPSRYTYSVRVGVVLIVAILLVKLMRQARYQRVVQWFFWVLILVIGYQVYNVVVTVNAEYPYAYGTGRTLITAVEKIAENQPKKIFVEWERPFERNFAHVVGLLEYVAQIPENRIIFLSVGQKVYPQAGEVVLHWDSEKEEYQVLYPITN